MSSLESPNPDQDLCDIYRLVTSSVLITLCCAVSFLGNSLTLLTFNHSGYRSVSPTVILLQALAVVDTTILIPPLFVSVIPSICKYANSCNYYQDTIVPYLWAYLWPFSPISHVSTIWITVLVTVQRYMAVCQPLAQFTSKLERVRTVRLQVTAVLLGAVVYNIPRFLENEIVVKSTDNGSYVFGINRTELYYNNVYQILYKNVLFFACMSVIPLVTLCVLTFRLVRELRRSRHSRQELAAGRGGDRGGNREMESGLSLSLLGVVLAFLLCQTPAVVNRLLTLTLPPKDRQCGGLRFFFTPLSNLLVFINSSVNFFIYCLCSRTFRRHLKLRLACCVHGCHRDRESRGGGVGVASRVQVAEHHHGSKLRLSALDNGHNSVYPEQVFLDPKQAANSVDDTSVATNQIWDNMPEHVMDKTSRV